jgi:hypothetical protein
MVGRCKCGFWILYVNRLGTTLLLCIATELVFTPLPGHGCFTRRINISRSIFSFSTGGDLRLLFRSWKYGVPSPAVVVCAYRLAIYASHCFSNQTLQDSFEIDS